VRRSGKRLGVLVAWERIDVDGETYEWSAERRVEPVPAELLVVGRVPGPRDRAEPVRRRRARSPAPPPPLTLTAADGLPLARRSVSGF
jgi:hypothetical protein